MANFIELNKYLDFSLGDTFYDKIVVTRLNKTLLNSMPNSSSKQVYVKGFYYKYIILKKAVNMVECMDIDE